MPVVEVSPVDEVLDDEAPSVSVSIGAGPGFRQPGAARTRARGSVEMERRFRVDMGTSR